MSVQKVNWQRENTAQLVGCNSISGNNMSNLKSAVYVLSPGWSRAGRSHEMVGYTATEENHAIWTKTNAK